MIVVPAFARGEKGYPPAIDTIVSIDEIAITEGRDMANKVEQKWHLLRSQSGGHTSQGYLPAKQSQQKQARRKTDKAIQQVHTAPVATLLKKHIKLVGDQIFGLLFGIDQIGMGESLKAQPMNEVQTPKRGEWGSSSVSLKR